MPKTNNETIAAIATPSGRGGIGIVRISGIKALSVAKKIFFVPQKKNKKSELLQRKSFVSRKMYYGFILNPDNKKIIDEVLFVYMKAPNSYTKEDIVEIHTHGGTSASKSVLNLILNYGIKTASPGEFTKRAFLNGRIDLTQAEAVIDIINASNSKALYFAASQSAGSLKEKTDKVSDKIKAVLSEIEAAIDFLDDLEDDLNASALIDSINKIIKDEISPIIEFYENASFYRDGYTIAIAGRPNVGKSSLLNRFVRTQKAIVTDIPGTTRDIIEVRINFSEIPLILADTAGIHTSENPVEIIGIKRTKEYLKNADLTLFLLDVSAPLSDEDFEIYETLKNRNHIIVINKIDIAKQDILIEIKKKISKSVVVEISSLYNTGITALKNVIIEYISSFDNKGNENSILINMRQKKELQNAAEALKRGVTGLKNNGYLETISIELKEALQSLGNISGALISEDVLDRIFADFCIGK
ncbi:MAG: tRNA uridine-5-carboxymethylaminomethyl(34) synthesis GTPase MnmE [Deltaproteobacteria bacterium]|nr:tRNA uridine-5-carboxymethylaminomethyl(34) synthesis GTPase MnmE [Deltaproteobacteria bacterium]